jgi:hypothetical protein
LFQAWPTIAGIAAHCHHNNSNGATPFCSSWLYHSRLPFWKMA